MMKLTTTEIKGNDVAQRTPTEDFYSMSNMDRWVYLVEYHIKGVAYDVYQRLRECCIHNRKVDDDLESEIHEMGFDNFFSSFFNEAGQIRGEICESVRSIAGKEILQERDEMMRSVATELFRCEPLFFYVLPSLFEQARRSIYVDKYIQDNASFFQKHLGICRALDLTVEWYQIFMQKKYVKRPELDHLECVGMLTEKYHISKIEAEMTIFKASELCAEVGCDGDFELFYDCVSGCSKASDFCDEEGGLKPIMQDALMYVLQLQSLKSL